MTVLIDVAAVARAALRTQLFGLVNFPDVALENRIFEPTIDEPYVRESFKPSATVVASLGPNARLRTTGVYLLDIFTPQMLGVKQAGDLAQRLLNAFPAVSQLVYAGTTLTVQSSYKGPARVDSPWFIVPVTIEWYVDSINSI